MLMKICSRCGKKIPYDSTCKCIDKSRKDSYKEYKKCRQDKDRQAFYSSSVWIRLRDLVYCKFFGMCIVCLYKGAIVNATTVHHVIPTQDDNSRWLDESNLICVCSSCHKLTHFEYIKSEDSKKRMQDILFRLIKRFEKEYI